ncbi:MAG TPA: sensor histidine kinase [Nocardioides sp.]|nr:sensor histidine kinase [Nocardioides sp.]
MSQTRAAPVLAWMAGGAALGLVVAAALVGAGAEEQPWKLVLLPACWVVPGVLLAGGRGHHALGWLMLAVGGMFAASAFATQWVEAGHTAGAAWAIWYADRGASALVPCTLAVLLLLPDGRLPGPRWRPIAVAVLGVQAALVAAWCLVEGAAASPDSTWPVDPANPLGVLPSSWGLPLDDVSTWLLQAPLLLGMLAVAVRLRSRDADQRGRLIGVLAAAAVFALLVVLGRALWPTAAGLLDVAGSALLAAALTSAVLRRRLHGVDVVVHHAFVYAVLTGLIGLGYVGVVAAVGTLGEELPAYGVGVVTAAIALVLLPLRGHLQRLLSRAMYGETHDVGAAIRRLTDSVGTASSLDDVTAGLARAVAKSLRAAYVRIEADGSEATVGAPSGSPVRLPLMSGDRRVGTVSVALPHGRRWRERDREVLAELADHGGRAVHAVQLADALLTNRQLLVTAREDERSRLRRDLHDELGPTLAGLAMQLGILQEMLTSDPATAAERLARLEVAARHALEDVRRLSRGLRPPALDEVGLVGAIQQAGGEAGIRLDADATDVPELPAAVEVAAYRIGVEAVLNVARHAGVREASLELSADGAELRLRITDAGTGLRGSPAGVGVLAMRERAEEVGGRVDVVDLRPGVRVEARLPIAVAASEISAPSGADR